MRDNALDPRLLPRHHPDMPSLRTPESDRSRRNPGAPCIRFPRVIAALALLIVPPLPATPGTTVAWENLEDPDTPASEALVDADGTTPLSAGAESNGDGAVLALGYFTGATSSATFTGEWVPLTGPQAANFPLQATSVGDASSGGGTAAGYFTLQTEFDSADSAVYQRIPPVGTRLAIAIYNRSTIGESTHFNIVTHDAWQWEDPHPILPTFLFLNPATAGVQWLGGSGSAMRTAVPTTDFPGGAARAPARLINISTRGYVGTGDAQLIPGFVLNGTGSARVLIRAVGPTLGGRPFNVPGVLADPVLRVVRQRDGVVMAENDDWHLQPDWQEVRDAAAATGAFPLPNPLTTPTADAAVVVSLPVSPGGFTVNVTGKGTTTGIVIAEAYLTDLSPTAPTELVNISTRGLVGTADEIIIPGFVIGSGGPRRLLIRVAGPTLGTKFGVAGSLADPVIQVVPHADSGIAPVENDDWEDAGQRAAIAAATTQVGAWGLLAGSKDAAVILQVPASDKDRSFTVHVSGVGGATGLVITEIYELP